MELQECLRTAERTLRANQFVDINFTGENKDKSVSGARGNYVASINCLQVKELAYFVVVGPDGDQAERYIQAC